MLKSITQLKGCSIGATDGDIGRAVDFYFDDEKWTIRYLVADTSSWLPGRKVLVSPHFLKKVDWKGGRIEVSLAKERVKNSPSIDTDKPISRQQEEEYLGYYEYPHFYWTGPYLWGPVAYPAAAGYPEASPVGSRVAEEMAARREQSADIHLRSAREMMDYAIEASDGAIGHVEDFIVDDQDWAIRYMVVDTRNWWPGKKVLIAPPWVSRVDWKNSNLYVNLSRQAIMDAPEFDADKLDREYETRLHQHYGQENYWWC